MSPFQILTFPSLATTTVLLSVLFCMLGFLPSGLNSYSLECYDCVHTFESRFPLETPKDPKCIDPVKGGAPKVTCSSPDESCYTASGEGNFGIFGGMDILVRGCLLPESKKKEPDGCANLYGNLYLNKTFEVQRKLLRKQKGVEPILKKDSPDNVLSGTQIPEGANNSSNSSGTGTGTGTDTGTGSAKQVDLDYVLVDGKYCICNTKDLCNTILSAYNPNATIPPPTEDTDKGTFPEGAPSVISLLFILSQLILDI